MTLTELMNKFRADSQSKGIRYYSVIDVKVNGNDSPYLKREVNGLEEKSSPNAVRDGVVAWLADAKLTLTPEQIKTVVTKICAEKSIVRSRKK